MRRPSRKGLLMAFVLCANVSLTAQDLHSIGKENPFSVAGGLSVNQVFYVSDGIPARREPYRYFASGNLNLSLYGWSVPLTFHLADKKTSFSQPFNQYAIHPTWKWITAHAGYTSMSFSPYTVNGHIFLGGGIDVSPVSNWKVSALYGQFMKAVEADSSGRSPSVPSYQRNGYGLKVTYGTGRDFADLILFHAADEADPTLRIPDSLGVMPQENLVISLGGGKAVFKHFLLKAEVAASAWTKDIRAEPADSDHPLSKADILFRSKLSSSYYHAFKTSFDYQYEGWVIGVGYEKIDPGYRTLGAYYFNNDLENTTLNLSGGLLQGKVNVTASGGVQRDNLDENKVSSMRRLVSALNVNYMPSQRLNVAASWSGFQTHTNIRSQFQEINALTPYDNADTLNFTQISRNASLSGMYTMGRSEAVRQHLHFNMSWQDAADQQGQAKQHSGTTIYSVNAGYSCNIVPRNMTVAFTFNATVNDGPFIHTRMVGPNASLNRSFAERKLRTTLSASWNKASSRGQSGTSNVNTRLNAVWSVQNRHNINFSAVMAKRIAATEASRSSTEFTATLGYSYSFSKGSRGAPRATSP